MPVQETGKFIFMIPCWREKGRFKESWGGGGGEFEKWWVEPAMLPPLGEVLLGLRA